jgi:hypothetical protein
VILLRRSARSLLSDELEIIWKETRVLSGHFPGCTEESHEKHDVSRSQVLPYNEGNKTTDSNIRSHDGNSTINFINYVQW